MNKKLKEVLLRRLVNQEDLKKENLALSEGECATVLAKNKKIEQLYGIVVNDQHRSRQYPMVHFLSQAQDTVTISNWREMFAADGAPCPKEIGSDMCLGENFVT